MSHGYDDDSEDYYSSGATSWSGYTYGASGYTGYHDNDDEDEVDDGDDPDVSDSNEEEGSSNDSDLEAAAETLEGTNLTSNSN